MKRCGFHDGGIRRLRMPGRINNLREIIFYDNGGNRHDAFFGILELFSCFAPGSPALIAEGEIEDAE
jgi:hypothetical protein